jgi:hypothetical protein
VTAHPVEEPPPVIMPIGPEEEGKRGIYQLAAAVVQPGTAAEGAVTHMRDPAGYWWCADARAAQGGREWQGGAVQAALYRKLTEDEWARAVMLSYVHLPEGGGANASSREVRAQSTRAREARGRSGREAARTDREEEVMTEGGETREHGADIGEGTEHNGNAGHRSGREAIGPRKPGETGRATPAAARTGRTRTAGGKQNDQVPRHGAEPDTPRGGKKRPRRTAMDESNSRTKLMLTAEASSDEEYKSDGYDPVTEFWRSMEEGEAFGTPRRRNTRGREGNT